MKQGLISIALVCFLIFEVQYFNVFDIIGFFKSTVLDLKRSDKFLLLLQISIVLVLLGLVILYFIQKQLDSQRVAYNFNNKKSRSEYQKELIRETQKSVDALKNSEEYKKHKLQYKTSEDFINQRNLTAEEDLSEGELSDSDSCNENEQ